MSKRLTLRRLVSLLLAAFLLLLAHEPIRAQVAPAFFYYFQGSRVPLTVNPGLIAVRFRTGLSTEARRTIALAEGDVSDIAPAVELPQNAIEFLTMRPGADPLAAVAKFRQRPEVVSSGPVFQFPDGGLYAETEEFVARFKTGVSPLAVALFNLANGVEIARAQPFSNRVLILKPLPGNPHGARDLANAYVQSGWVEFAEPNFVISEPRGAPAKMPGPASPASVIPNDTYFYLQWSLQNTGQFQGAIPGADINAPAAWGLTTGSITPPGVIAIIDEGVDSTHPDLSGRVLTGYNAIDGSSNTMPTGTDMHGTASAGLAAAHTANNLGIAGVCWQCEILPVKVAYENSNHNWVTTTAELSAGIEWAWQHDADVLSNGWTMSAPSDDVRTAIIDARFGGREGYGSTVIFAAGNDNSSTISFPASMNNYVIAMGASNWCDQRKTPTSSACNNQDPFWGSNYGSGLDLVAPGEAVLTTCSGGNCGPNGPVCPVGYVCFAGTSASTPLAAGAAALLYALNPTLQPSDIQNALQNGAHDIPPTGWDSQTGYGRLDAYRAMSALYDTAVGVTDNGSLVRPGALIQYSFAYSNIGLTDMPKTILTATLPTGVTYVGSNPPFTPVGGGVYQLSLGTLHKYDTGTATMQVQVQPGTGGQTLVLTVQIGGQFPELKVSDNTATDRVAVAASTNFLPFILR